MKPASAVLEERAEAQVARAAELHGDGAFKMTDDLEVRTALVSRVRNDWHRNRSNKTIVEKRLLNSLRARKGEYSPEKIAEIRDAGGSQLYVKLTTAKVRTAIAHMKSVMMPTGSWSHGISPTKEPTMPPWMAMEAAEYLQANPMFIDENGEPVEIEKRAENLEHMIRTELSKKAKTAARRMERKIYDQLQEGGWRKALSDFIDDLCTYQAAFMKGPYFVNKAHLTYEMDETGQYVPTRTVRPTMQWGTIDPFDAYPAPGSDSVHRGSFIERLRLTREDIYAMRETPEVYDVDAIDRVIEMKMHNRLDNWLWTDSERQRIADHTYFWYAQSSEFDGLHWYGEALGSELIEHGVPESEIEDLNRPYQVDVILIGNEIIKATLNRDPLYRRNISHACYEDTPGTVWGNSISDLMEDSQAMVNSSARALQNNLAHASGFQVEVDYTRLHPNTDPTDIYPFKVWQGKESEFSGDRPVARFFQPDSNASELLGVMSQFARQADIDTGIPSYIHGGDSSEGASATAKAATMAKDDTAKLLRSAMINVDEDMITPTLEFVYDFNMLYDPDTSIKGDTHVVAKGMNAALQREGARQQHMAVLDLLGNPEDRELLGDDKRFAIIRNFLDTYEEIDTDEIIPTDDEIRFKLEQRAMQPPPPDPKMVQIEVNKEIADAKLAFDREKLERDAETARGAQALDLQKAAMDREVQIQVSQDDLDKKLQNEMIKLKAARQSAYEVAQLDIQKTQMQIEAKAREKVQDLRNQLALQRATGQSDESTPGDAEGVQAEVESILLPLMDGFKKETMDAIKLVADMVNQEAGFTGDINVEVNLPDCKPGAKEVTMQRDAQGNLKGSVTPVGAA